MFIYFYCRNLNYNPTFGCTEIKIDILVPFCLSLILFILFVYSDITTHSFYVHKRSFHMWNVHFKVPICLSQISSPSIYWIRNHTFHYHIYTKQVVDVDIKMAIYQVYCLDDCSFLFTRANSFKWYYNTLQLSLMIKSDWELWKEHSHIGLYMHFLTFYLHLLL